MITAREKQELGAAVKYKIHAVTSVNGVGRSSNNNVFYDTYDEAYEQVLGYLARGDNDLGFVIMKTIAIIKNVEPVPPDVNTFMVSPAGTIRKTPA